MENNVNQQQPPNNAPGGQPQDNMMAVLTHVLAIPTGFIMPLVMYLMKDPKVLPHAKNALNFQLTVMIAWFVSWLLIFVIIGGFLMPVVLVVDIVFCIIAAVKANQGIVWKYPLSIPFIK